MSSLFFESSKKIANDFLQSIVFVDDRAFIKDGPPDHEFDTIEIIKAFAKSKKICAVYNPESSEDIENLALLAKKADVTVLDWQININEESHENGEKDAENDDPRGPHTRKIIREILSDPLAGRGSLKLILIYTGEVDLPGITEDIYKDLQILALENLNTEDCSIFTENIKILIIAKPLSSNDDDKPRFKHNPSLNSKVINYDALPDFILTKFTEMTAGLLTNFVLQSLTAIRQNTFRLIKLYKKELDPSFLANRLLLPNPEDSKEMLVEIFSHSIEALLNYNEVGEIASSNNINTWLDTNVFNQVLPVDGDSKKNILVDNEFIKTWIDDSFVNACKKQWVENRYSNEGSTPDKKFESIEKDLHKKATGLFVGVGADILDSEFSILTHHKSNLKQPSLVPRLTLGTLLKQLSQEKNNPEESEIQQSERYFLCIQARCDSVRVKNIRKFLFLPLQRVDEKSKFQFVIEDDAKFVRLCIVKESFELRTIKFQPGDGHNIIQAEESEGQFYFISNHGERFKWLADLKDLHAQREANNFAAKISRVGLDESEWLRRWAK